MSASEGDKDRDQESSCSFMFSWTRSNIRRTMPRNSIYHRPVCWHNIIRGDLELTRLRAKFPRSPAPCGRCVCVCMCVCAYVMHAQTQKNDAHLFLANYPFSIHPFLLSSSSLLLSSCPPLPFVRSQNTHTPHKQCTHIPHVLIIERSPSHTSLTNSLTNSLPHYTFSSSIQSGSADSRV